MSVIYITLVNKETLTTRWSSLWTDNSFVWWNYSMSVKPTTTAMVHQNHAESPNATLIWRSLTFLRHHSQVFSFTSSPGQVATSKQQTLSRSLHLCLPFSSSRVLTHLIQAEEISMSTCTCINFNQWSVGQEGTTSPSWELFSVSPRKKSGKCWMTQK